MGLLGIIGIHYKLFHQQFHTPPYVIMHVNCNTELSERQNSLQTLFGLLPLVGPCIDCMLFGSVTLINELEYGMERWRIEQ